MKKLYLASLAALPLSLLLAAPIGDEYMLHTKNTTLAIRKGEYGWNLLHYGKRLNSAADARALSWDRGESNNAYVQRRAALYSVYGEKALTGVNKYGGLQVTHADGCVSTYLVAEKAETVSDAAGAEHLVLTMKDAAYPFQVVQHFRALAAADVIETWVELVNHEAGPVKLARMDSLAINLAHVADDFRVQSLHGQWASEAKVTDVPLGRGQTIAYGSRSGVRDAFESNASFMLTLGSSSSETSGEVIGGVLCWSGMWGISIQRDFCDFLELRAGAENCSGPYVLDPGKSITLPKAAFTYSNCGKGQVSRNFHRWARDWHLPAGHKPRPVLLNSWEGSYFSFTEKVLHDMMDGVKEMGGELFVLDDGWFGTGKYARDDKNRDRVGLGDWIINPEKLPHGLKGLADEARRRGLKFGFWVEPEMVCTNSWIYEAHPDWVLREQHRPVNVGRGRSQTVLDFSNPAVRENIHSQLTALYRDIPDLSYIKWDANADFYNLGSTYLAADHQANLAFDYTTGLYELLAKFRAEFPTVDIQACSSGGGHVDYGFLAYADEFWGSDDSDARERVFIQWGESQFYPACLIGAHVTDVPNHQTRRTTPLKYRFDVAMSGRFGFELHPQNLSADDLSFAKSCVATYKRIRPTIQQGDLYRLVSPYGHTYSSIMYVNEAKNHAVVFLWGLSRGNWSDFPPPLPIAGLDAAKKYRIAEINRIKKAAGHCRVDGMVLGGDSLMAMGLPVRLKGDWDSAVFELKAE